MLEFIIVGVGGFIGCCLRFGITKLMLPLELQFPAATLVSNVLAGFIVGFVGGLERNTLLLSPKTKLFITTGMMGGLSTFSTFSMETVDLFHRGKYLLSAGNILLNVAFSLVGVVLGLLLAKILFKQNI